MKHLVGYRCVLLLVVALAILCPPAFTDTASSEIVYDSGGRRNPFAPLIDAEGVIRYGFNSTSLNVEGIIFDPKAGSIALIDGESYKEGETVQNMNIVSIFKDRVILAKDDQEKTLWIREEILQEGEKKHDTKNEQTKK